MKRMTATLVLCFAFIGGGISWSEPISVASLPPSIVKTIPESGDNNVDALATTQIKVTFSKDMMDGNWSWVQISDSAFPKIEGTPRYLDDMRTCVIDVKLEPNKTYAIWINTDKFRNFKDKDMHPAVPYLLVFKTK